jgi:hypothetical protein
MRLALHGSLMAYLATLLSACATSGVSSNLVRCPVDNIETARGIAASTLAAYASESHQGQTGYRIDVTDKGRFWQVHDGSNPAARDDGILMIQFGGSSVDFRIAKCSGAISHFTFSSWK